MVLAYLKEKTEIICRDLGKPKNSVTLNNFEVNITNLGFLG
jgi:hypothetical protein